MRDSAEDPTTKQTARLKSALALSAFAALLALTTGGVITIVFVLAAIGYAAWTFVNSDDTDFFVAPSRAVEPTVAKQLTTELAPGRGTRPSLDSQSEATNGPHVEMIRRDATISEFRVDNGTETATVYRYDANSGELVYLDG